MINVAVIPGWGGGQWHLRAFLDALRAGGFELTEPARADVIIAHSLACYDLPAKTPAVLYVLIDPPYWPGKSLAGRYWSKIRQDISTPRSTRGLKFVVVKYFWNLAYMLAKPQSAALAINQTGS